MIDAASIFYFSFFGAALLLSVMGVWFTAVIPGLDRWSKRFFLCYFVAFLLCCLSSMLELIPLFFSISKGAFYVILAVESLLLSVPLPMLTAYLLHCRGKTLRQSRLLWVVTALWAVYFVLVVASPYIGSFTIVTEDFRYYRGPLYALALAPLIAILLLDLASAVGHRARLSRKVFLSFVIATVPMVLALTVQMFIDAYPLIDVAYVLSAMSMYGLVLSDQLEQERSHQREIARQQTEIANQRSRIMVLQMRPHFIYNTLMSIYGLCGQDPQKARQVTMDFTNYLRKNFNAVASDSPIPFTAELEHTRAYLAVEQAQHEDMLAVDYDVPFVNFRLPPLTLQPIVENAVKHGILSSSEPLHVSIRTRQSEVGAEITVADTGPGFDPADETTPHTALTNIRQRLEIMCGGTLDIEAREEGGTRVTIRVPLRGIGEGYGKVELIDTANGMFMSPREAK